MSDKNFTAIKLVKRPLTISLTTSVLAGCSALPSVPLVNAQTNLNADGMTENSLKVSHATAVVNTLNDGELTQQDTSIQPLGLGTPNPKLLTEDNSNSDNTLQTFVPETPVNNAQVPVNTTQQPVNNAQVPVNTTQQPVNNAQVPVNTTQQPVNNAQASVNTTQQPVNNAQVPVNTTQQPVNNNLQTFAPQQEANNASELPASMIEQPFITIGQRVEDSQNNYTFYDDVRSGRDEIYLANLSAKDWAADNALQQNSQKRLANAARKYRVSGIWKEVSSGYKLPRNKSKKARNLIEREKFLLVNKKRGHLDRSLQNSTDYIHYTLSEARRRNLPSELALLPLVESGYNPRSYSRAGAVGLWQITPITARELNIERNASYDGRYDLIDSTEGAYRYLKRLYKRYRNWELALAAYNAGPKNVDRAIRKNKSQGKPTDFWSLPLPRETKVYVPRLMAFAEIIENPGYYSMRLPAVSNRLSFEKVQVGNGVSLNQVVAVTGVSSNKIKDLNLGLRRRRVDVFVSDKRVLVPRSVSQAKINKIRRLSGSTKTKSRSKSKRSNQQVSNSRRNTGAYHIVRRGETLSGLARKFAIRQSRLARYNNISATAMLKVGQKLLLSDGKARAIPQPKRVPQKSRKQQQRQYSSSRYKVVSGDTLSGIARKFGTTTQSIASVNPFDAEYMVKIDEYIVIPRKKSNKLISKAKSSSKPRYKSKASQKYTVQSGDSLSRLAQKFGVSIKSLAKANKLGVESHLKSDQVINVPKASKSTQSKSVKIQAKTSKKASKAGRYEVKPGDTLSRLANKYGTTVAQIVKVNGFANKDSLNAGAFIKLPSNKKVSSPKRLSKKSASSRSYEVQSGDGLTRLAKKFGINLKDLAKANNISTTSEIQIGQKLRIPY